MMMVALMLVATAAVGGCTPRRADMTAVLLDGGVPAVLFAPCRGSHVFKVSVVTAGTSSAAWSVANSGGAAGVGQMRLLEVPTGWVVQTATLASFAEGETYLVWADTDRPVKGNDTGVTFTLADLSGLADGQVWAKAGGSATAMSRAEFGRRAKDACG